MNFENEIFKRANACSDKLLAYGFKRNGNKYIYSKSIMNDTFRVDVEINNNVKVKVIDLAFNEEYNNYRIDKDNSDFVNEVRSSLTLLLNDIKDKCFIPKYFISEQANRITDLIVDKYGNKPEFVWDKFPGYGIFKNPNNAKWYGIIMNINRNKLSKKSNNEEIEIINVKLDEEKIKELVKQDGFYKAYHMNKNNWISITLDDTLSDKQIMDYIIESHKYTE